MSILKLFKALILSSFLLIYNCKEVHKKPKGYCNKYISGGMLMNFKVINDITDNEFKSIKIKSKNKGDLFFLEKLIKYRRLIIKDTLLLTDTLFISFKSKVYKMYDFKNGDIDVYPGERGDNYEQCLLKEVYFNNKLLKKKDDRDITIKIEF